ncbi:MAG: hypothetical protein Kow0090_21100 [Myxococcota bacterium]
MSIKIKKSNVYLWASVAIMFSFLPLLSLSCGGGKCEELQDKARNLVDSYKQCGAGDECEIVNLYNYAGSNNCIEAFQCSTAFRKGYNKTEFSQKVSEILSDYQGCNMCVMAGCIAQVNKMAVCNQSKGICEFIPQDDESSGEDDDDNNDDNDDDSVEWQPVEVAGVKAYFELWEDRPPRDFFATPFPSDLRKTDDGKITWYGFPNPKNSELIDKYTRYMEAVQGFGNSAACYFHFDGELNTANIPTTGAESISANAKAFIVNIDPTSDEYGLLSPARYKWFDHQTNYTPDKILAIAPVYGFPLLPKTKYACVVLRSLEDSDGNPLGSNLEFEQIKSPEPYEAEYLEKGRALFAPLWETLEQKLHISRRDIASATVFTTQDPTKTMRALRDYIHSLPAPKLGEFDLSQQAEYNDFYYLEASFEGPQFQFGDLPFDKDDTGYIVLNEQGTPEIQRYDTIRISILIPKTEMPPGGFPVTLFSHGTGGNHRNARTYAPYSAARGVAWVGFEAIHHGIRNAKDGVENSTELYFFNFTNPYAGRDNVLQTAADAVSLLMLVKELSISASDSPTGKEVIFDSDKIFFMGHSQGALIGPPFYGVEPECKAAMFSAGGAGFGLSLLQKTEPIDIRKIVRSVLGVEDEELDEFHPAVTLVQTFVEPADGGNYAPLMIRRPIENASRHVFISQSYEDHYTPPDTISALALSIGIQQVEPIIKTIPNMELLKLSPISRPVSGNLAGTGGEPITGVVIQYDGSDCSDGHFVISCTEQGKIDLGEFLSTMAEDGIPKIPAIQ